MQGSTPPPPEPQANSFNKYDTQSGSPTASDLSLFPPAATIEEPCTNSTSRQGTPESLSLLTHSPPLPSIAKDELLKSLLADPETKSRLISMLQSEQAEPTSLSQLSGRASTVESGGGRLGNTTPAQSWSQPHTRANLEPLVMSLSPAELRHAGTPSTQSQDAITQTPGNSLTSTSSLSMSEEGERLSHVDSRASELSVTSSLSSGIGSIGPTPVHSNPAPRQLTHSSTLQHKQLKGMQY